MTDTLIDKIARAVLYEGYILYPYRPSTKNTQRWTFGGIFPRAYTESNPTDPSELNSQCLLTTTPDTKLSLTLRFLQLTDRTIHAAPNFAPVDSIRVNNAEYRPWQEATERKVSLPNLSLAALYEHPVHHYFCFSQSHATEPLHENGQLRANIIRHQKPLAGLLELRAKQISGDLAQLTLRVINQSACPPHATREEAQLQSFASTHAALSAKSATFISLTDPPAKYAPFAAQCQNTNCWPILIGEPAKGGVNPTDTLLISPIILPDYPQIAPESPGDLFDSGEIDEILTLRIMTLTDEEKAQAASTDFRVKQMLERTHALAREQLANLHGAVRRLTPVAKGADHA